jgi:hypothetical protein
MAGRLFRRSREADVAAPSSPLPGLSVEVRPVDVQLFTSDGVGDVQVLAGSGRVTELLNSAEPMRIRSRHEAPDAAQLEWVDVDVEGRDEILAVIPPPRDTNPLQRLHRPAQEVEMRVGPYLVTGEAHVPAGSEATGFLMRHRPHFVPLTNARISEPGVPDVKAPVVIVNLWMAESLTDADVPDPATRVAGSLESAQQVPVPPAVEALGEPPPFQPQADP